jgi:hypothetical protein
VQASCDTGAFQWLFLGVFVAGRHETGHFILSKFNLAAAERREADVGDLVLVGGGRHGGGGVLYGMERVKRRL